MKTEKVEIRGYRGQILKMDTCHEQTFGTYVGICEHEILDYVVELLIDKKTTVILSDVKLSEIWILNE